MGKIEDKVADITKERLVEVLKIGGFDKAEITPEFLSLVEVGIISHEFGFHKGKISKDDYIKEIARAWDLGASEKFVDIMSDNGLERYKDKNLILTLKKAINLVYNHKSQKYEITKENYIKWIDVAWDRGTHQRKIYNMEVEGCIDNILGIASNLGAILCLYSKKEGYMKQYGKTADRS
jgi:hypothetical protein